MCFFFLDYDILDFCVLQTAVNIMFVLFRAFLKSNNLDRRKFNHELTSFFCKYLKFAIYYSKSLKQTWKFLC